jgi:hypothetical protein
METVDHKGHNPMFGTGANGRPKDRVSPKKRNNSDCSPNGKDLIQYGKSFLRDKMAPRHRKPIL